jgi:hypothetical protein
MGAGFNGNVETILPLHDGRVLAGGSFGLSGSTTLNRLAQWNGSSWSAMHPSSDSWNAVYALCLDGAGDLAVGGDMFTVNGNTCVHFARYSFGHPCCDPDFTQDGNADQDDVAYLISVIAGGPNPTGRDPDFTLDGNADQDDVAALVNVIAGGACP